MKHRIFVSLTLLFVAALLFTADYAVADTIYAGDQYPTSAGSYVSFAANQNFSNIQFTGDSNASYPAFWFFSGSGGTATHMNASINTWFTGGVLNYTASSATYTSGVVKVYAATYTRPTYILGLAYDLTSDYDAATNTLTLTTLNATSPYALFTRPWGDFYIVRADSAVTSLSWTGLVFTVQFHGAAGVFKLYCGARGEPPDATGLSGTSFDTSTLIYTGSYAANGTVTLDWTVTPAGGGGISGTGQTNSTAIAFEPIDLGVHSPGDVATVLVNVTYTGSNLRVTRVEFPAPFDVWLVPEDVYPVTFYTNHGELTFTLNVPVDAGVFSYTETAWLYGLGPSGEEVSASTPLSLTVAAAEAPAAVGVGAGEINPLLYVVIAGVAAVAVVAAATRKK